MKLAALDTPCLILDQHRLDRNLAAMNARARRLGVKLRPHMKTAKSIDVFKRLPQDLVLGVTVSTLNEAAYFGAHGVRDIVYGVCISPQKLACVAQLQKKIHRLTIITDSLSMARQIADRAEDCGGFSVMIELDSGESRTGTNPHGKALLEIARILNRASGVSLRGVLTHAGHSYHCRTPEAIAAVAEDERRLSVAAAARLREAGIPCEHVSVGSTPTAAWAKDLTGVTEIRPGVYMFGDLFQASVGTCSRDDIALTVLTTVIGRRPGQNRLVVDAGALALSKDRSTEKSARDFGYGLVLDEGGREIQPELIVASVHQEHGEVTAESSIPFDQFPVGTRLRVLPNHACITAAMHDRYHVVAGDDEVIATWPRTQGW